MDSFIMRDTFAQLLISYEVAARAGRSSFRSLPKWVQSGHRGEGRFADRRDGRSVFDDLNVLPDWRVCRRVFAIRFGHAISQGAFSG